MGRVLGLVPARGGSKGVPDKNSRQLAGKPLLEYVVEAAAASGVVDRLVLSTDDRGIAELGERLGMEVPFMRPPDLATDSAPMLPVIQHAVRAIEASGWEVEVVVLLQPTSPLRRGDEIRRAVELLQSSEGDSVVTVQQVPPHLSPDYVLQVDGGLLMPFLPEGERCTRRQDVRPAYYRDGTVYCTRKRVIESGSIYGARCVPLLMPRGASLSIDTEEDWSEAERVLRDRGAAR
ncbi:MAG: acylneuraminate cytidylyltransferase family protein [Gemmatimonadales bacterium]